MTMTTSEANRAEDVVPSVPPTLVESGSAAPATKSVHADGSVYTCPACRKVENPET
jgi:hypothetical protein